MESKQSQPNKSLSEVIRNLMDDEKVAMELFREEADRVEDPSLRSVFMRLAEIRARGLSELESNANELSSLAEITAQINAMF
jgi:rubrerythrin